MIIFVVQPGESSDGYCHSVVKVRLTVFKTIDRVIRKLKEHVFLFQQLVHRDFAARYKGTWLGMSWSILSPLLQLLVMMLVFSRIFGRNVDHYVIYMFAGNIIMSYYRESTQQGMLSLNANAHIITKINVPKYLFLLSRNVSAIINFGLTIGIFFLFCIGDHIKFTPAMFMLPYSIVCLIIMNIGIGMVLSALYVFFRDMTYLYSVFLTLLNYLSAIFYTLDHFSARVQRLYLLNPVYANIKYWRVIVLDGHVPSIPYHALLAFYALFFLALGSFMYKRFNTKFIYYF